jgi:carboxyl-terminal processing protease
MLRGPMNTTVKLTYLRDGTSRQVSITRGLIPVSPIDAAYMIEPHTGYLRINKFAERTYEAFMQAMEKLKAQGMQKLVLDLRGNGGGLMKEATDIADEFLSGDKLIVYTEGAHVPRLEYRCKRDGIFENGPLAVLIDEGTASASEVLTGALQDWDRATIIGRRSFGKGLVQQQFQLTDGSAVRLTIARYFTPLGRNIQKSYSAGKEEYEKELADRFHDGEVVKEDTSRHGSKAYKTPAGRVVYGGGGITPDDFVPFDTSYMSPTLMSLTYKGTLSDFVYRYYLQNKTRFSQVSSPAKLATVFAPGEPEWHALENFARADSIRIDRVSSREKTDILQRVAALMGRQIWRMEGYFEVSNQYDATVQEALRKLR